MTRLLPILFLLLISLGLNAQNYTMDNIQINDCGGFFLDSGGADGSYGPNENSTMTICPDFSSGTHIQLVFSAPEIMAGDNLCFFDGTDPSAMPLFCAANFDAGAPFIVQATAENPTGCLTLTFDSDGTGEGAGWSADINCIPACQSIELVLLNSDPPVEPADTGYIDICPGDGIQLEAEGFYPQNGTLYQQSDLTSTFTWDFGDGTSGFGPNVYKRYDNPGGYVIQLTIRDTFGCTNINFLSQRVRVSTFPDFQIAGDIPDEVCSGDTIDLTARISTLDSIYEVIVNPTIGSFQTSGTRSDSLPLPDGTGASYSTSILFSDFSPGQILTDINDLLGVCVSMEHSWIFDLDILITCPSGTSVLLQSQDFIGNETWLGIPNHDDSGTPPAQGVGDDYCWTPTSTNGNWTEYINTFDPATLPSQDYNSFESLENLLGCPLNGEWTITVIDQWSSDNGWIFQWGIDFEQDLYPSIETFTPEVVDYGWIDHPSIFYSQNDSINASPQNAGTASYTFEIIDNFGCSSDTTVLVDVLPDTHPNCFNCGTEVVNSLLDQVTCPGDPVNVDATTITALSPQEVTFEAFANEEINFLIYPPSLPFVSTLNINSVFPLNISDATNDILSVCIEIEHKYDKDLDIFLRAPDGTLLELTTDNGGSGDNYEQTCFTPSATDLIIDGVAPFTGNFVPEGDWTTLNGQTTNGEWALLVSDDSGGFNGTLIGWTITFNIDNDVDYQWQTSTDLSCDNCPDPIVTTNTDNQYIVEISDAFNCSVNDTVLVALDQAFPAPSISCSSDSPDEIVFSWLDVAGASGYEVSLDAGMTWIPANATLGHNVTGLVIGQQIMLMVRAMAMNTTCTAAIAQSMCVTDGCMIDIETTGMFPPTCPDDMDGTIFVSVMGGSGVVEYFIDGTGPMPGPFNGLASGMHTIIGVDENNCRDTLMVDLQPTAGAMQLTFAVDSVQCNGESTGEATVNVTGGNGNYMYQWNTIPVTSSPTANGLAQGIYTVQITDMEGCSVTEMVEVFEPPLLEATLTTDSVNCNGANDGSATLLPLGGSAPYDYIWSNAQTSDVATALSPGNYSYTVADAKGCMTTNSFDIFEPAPIVAIADSTDASCFGFTDGNLFVNHSNTSGLVVYDWSGPNGFTSSLQNPINIGVGNYCVTITDAKGCETSTCTAVNEPIEIALLGNTTAPSCSDSDDGTATVMPSGGSGNYQYLWSINNQMTPTATGLPSGTHTVTVTDMNGCFSSIPVTVPTVAAIELTMDNTTPTCSNTTDGTAIAMASGGVGMLTYQWGNNASNQTTSTATNLSDGQYCVTVSDQNLCSVTNCVDLMTPNPIIIDGITETPVGCYGMNDGEALVAVQGGTGTNYTFLWDDPNAQFANPAIGLEAGSYNVTVSDMNGCTTSSSVTVSEPDSLELATAFTDVSCFGENNGTATALPSGGVEPYTYNWSDTQSTPTATDLLAGNMIITVTDANNCPAIEQIMIPEPSTALSVTIDQTNIACFETNDGQATIAALGGTPGTSGYQYTWSDGVNTGNIGNNLESGNYTVTISDENACSLVENIFIDEHAAVDVNIAFVQPTCFGQSNGKLAVNFITRGINEDSLNRYTFEWLNNGATSPFIDGLSGGQTYQVRAIDSLGCVGEGEKFLTEPAPLRIEAASTNASCFGSDDGSANVVQVFGGASNEYTYDWNSLNGATTALVDSLIAGAYSVTVTDTLGCSVDTIVNVGQPASLDVRFDLVENSCAGGSDGKMFATAQGGIPNYNYQWSTGSVTDSVVSIWSGLHYITITDGNNCLHRDSVRLGQAPAIRTDLVITDPTCFGDRDGQIKVELEGGTPPFRYSVDGENYLGSSVLIGLTAGEYELFVLDANNCIHEDLALIKDPPQFTVNAGDDTSIEVGDSTQLNPSFVNNIGEVELIWSAPYEGTLFCPVDTIPCVDPQVNKLNNTIQYELYGIDENGCESTDEITIEVIKIRNIHVATAFTPNGDGANDLLIVHGKEGTKILTFRVYDRWGTLVHEDTGIDENGQEYMTNEDRGWDGIYRGKEVDPGVFLWKVEVEYIDGLKESFQGSSTLLR